LIFIPRVSAGRWEIFAAHRGYFDSPGLIVGSHKSNETYGFYLSLAARFSEARIYILAVRVCEESASHEEQTLVEDRLDGSSKFNSWKSRLHVTLEESDLLRLIEGTLPTTTTDEENDEWKTYDVKSRKIIIYSIRDHLLPHISTFKTTYLLYDALKKMSDNNNTNIDLTLKHQLQNLKRTKYDTITTFFMKISEIRDQLGAIGEAIIDIELVMITLNGLPSHCVPFIQSISGRED
jgi:hypothetical protein